MAKTMQHPLILATTRQVDKKTDGPANPVIRLKLDKPPHWDWQLTTTADDLPVIQLLDRDGKILVETTGRVAQRARGTFKDGLKFHESFPEPLKEESPPPTPEKVVLTGNRNYEGFSSKYGPVSFGFKPRKSSSEATVSSTSLAHRRKKRHSANESELEKLVKNAKKEVKRYSAGDYLRQQILEDLASGKLSDEADGDDTNGEAQARNRYKKIKAYLRSQSDGTARCSENESPQKKEPTLGGKKLTQEDLDKIRRFLQDKIHAKMQEEHLLQRTFSVPVQNEIDMEKVLEGICLDRAVKKRHSGSPKTEDKPRAGKNYKTRKIRSDANIRFGPETCDPSKSKSENQKVVKRDSSGSEKRKVYRKTKSDIFLSHRLSGPSFDSVKDQPASSNYPTRRIKSQDNLERSWREYRERKKQERLQLKDNCQLPAEEDFMKKPRWKDNRENCKMKNCKFCENMNNYIDSMKKPEPADEEIPKRPGTSLQENYVMIDPPKSPIYEPDFQNGTTSPDFGYNTIPKVKKKPKEAKEDSFSNSSVKKSDTFKVVDGGDDNDSEVCCDYSDKTNEEIAKDYFKRVYELLRKRQEEAKNRLAEGRAERYEDTSSSNCIEDEGELIKKRRRRRKMDKTNEGEEPILGKRDGWNGSSSSGRLQQGSSQAKRPRHPPPPLPAQSSSNKENEPADAGDDAPGVDQEEEPDEDMGANHSRHHGHKSLNGRRAQSSGNLCDSKTITNVGKFIVPCPRSSREKYKFCGSLPNHLDGKDPRLDGARSENNNVITDTICGNLGGTLPHKRSHVSSPGGGNFSDDSGEFARHHRSDESLDGDPWKYRQEGADLARCRYMESLKKKRGSDAGCPHHHHQHQHHHEWRRNSSTLSRGSRCHRSAELEVASSASSTLPKRRQDSTKRSAPSLGELGDGPTRASRISIDKIDDDLLLKMVRRSSCKGKSTEQKENQPNGNGPSNNHQKGKCVDLKLYKLSASGEPLDQGYASERSPEDEHPPSLPGQPFPNVKPENTFRVTLTKSSRGLGLSVSGGGTAGPVRVKRLFPQQPAALSNKLQSGDILLAANEVPLTGLTNYEALEVLRTTSSTVELVVCRLPGGEAVASPTGTAPPPPPTRKKDNKPALTLKIPLNPLPPLDVEPTREFDIEMTKVGGSLGFTLRKADSSALGHYVRALVREPALSDGRIQPGDKIIAVDGEDLSPLSHEEAVALLRKCGPKVKLRLYRDLAQTPVSALSPTETEYPLRPAKPSLRQEAVDMLCDLAVRKLSPGTSSGGSTCPRQSSGGSSNSPRRLRRPATRSSTADTDDGSRNNRTSRASTLSQETSDSDQCSIKTQITNSQPETPGGDHIIDPPALYDACDSSDSSLQLPLPPPPPTSQPPYIHRPSYLNLEQQRYNNGLDSDCSDSYAGPVIVTDSDTSNFDYSSTRAGLSSDEHDLPNEPMSMPPILSSASSTSTAFSYKNPAYQSANPACYSQTTSTTTTTLLVPEPVHHHHSKNVAGHSSEQDIPGKVLAADDPGGSKGLLKWKGVMFAPSDSDDSDGKCKVQVDKDVLDSAALHDLHEPGFEVFMVELTRGWNSRLGFSLQQDGDDTVISVVHPDSVAAKDGRLKQGDILIIVNDESVLHMSTANIIDLLRKIRGSIGITVLRRKQDSDAT